MTCPRCEGRDLTQAGFRLVNRGGDGCTMEPHPPCEMCGGSGQITEALSRCYQIGRSFHQHRVLLRLSLMDIATAWGCTPP